MNKNTRQIIIQLGELTDCNEVILIRTNRTAVLHAIAIEDTAGILKKILV